MKKTLRCMIEIVGIFLLCTISPTSAIAAYELESAAIAGNKEQLMALIADGADITGNTGARILYFAIYNLKYEVAEFLVTHGAYVNTKVENGDPPLHAAVKLHSIRIPSGEIIYPPLSTEEANIKLKIAELLIAHGADVNFKNGGGVTPLDVVATGAMAVLLINHGANIHGDSTLNHHGSWPLYFAVTNNRVDVAEILITHGASVKFTKSAGQTVLSDAKSVAMAELLIKHGANIQDASKGANSYPLYSAVINNRADVAEVLISHGADVNHNSKSMGTPLSVAVRNNRKEIVKLLIDKGADINIKLSHGDPILMGASLDIAQILINNGADINVKNSEGKTPLSIAIDNNNVDMVRLLLNHGAKINEITDRYTGRTEFFSAMRVGSISLVELLLQKGANINALDSNGMPPLASALWYKRKDIVELLINRGADVNILSKNGDTLLQGHSHNIDMFELLLKHGVNVNAKNKYGNTLLWSVCCDSEPSELLIKYGAGINIRNSEGRTILHLAAQSGRNIVAKWLIDHGSDINAQDDMGQTPIFYAVRSYNRDIHFIPYYGYEESASELSKMTRQATQLSPLSALNNGYPIGMDTSNSKAIVELLLLNGANINATDRLGQSLLHVAPTKDITKLLIDRKIHLNIKRHNDGATALHIAAEQGLRDVVKILLEHGADVNATDKFGNTPLHRAKEWAIVGLLIDHAAVVNAKNGDGNTPLLHFIRTLITNVPSDGGSIEILRALVLHGADINQSDSSGIKPLTYLLQIKANPAYRNFISLITSLEELFVSQGAKTEN